MVIDATWKALLAHLFLGLVVGLIIQISRPFPSLTPILPTLSAVVGNAAGHLVRRRRRRRRLLRQVPVHGSSTRDGCLVAVCLDRGDRRRVVFLPSAPRGSLLWFADHRGSEMLAQTVAGS